MTPSQRRAIFPDRVGVNKGRVGNVRMRGGDRDRRFLVYVARVSIERLPSQTLTMTAVYSGRSVLAIEREIVEAEVFVAGGEAR